MLLRALAETPDMLRLRALCLLRLNATSAALDLFARVREMAPDDPWVALHFGIGLQTTGRNEEAEKCFAQGGKNHGRPGAVAEPFVLTASLGECEPLAFDRLEDMKLTEMAFKETLRLIPPVPTVPRRALREFSFRGITIPAGTSVAVNPLFTHHMPEDWPEPSTFNPVRFAEATSAAPSQAGILPGGAPPGR